MKEDKNNENKKKNLSKSQEESSIKNKEDDDNKNKWKKSQILYDNDINTIEPKNKMNQTERKEINQEKNALKTLDNNIGFSSYNMTQTNQVKEKDEVIVDKGKMIYKKERVEIIYRKHEFVQVIDKLNTDFTKRKEKIKPNQYKLVDINDPDLFDGAIKCAQLKCILFGILSCLLNSFRLIYLIFLHLIYPIILWAVRCIIAVFCFCCFMFEKEEVYIDPETKLRIVYSVLAGFMNLFWIAYMILKIELWTMLELGAIDFFTMIVVYMKNMSKTLLMTTIKKDQLFYLHIPMIHMFYMVMLVKIILKFNYLN